MIVLHRRRLRAPSASIGQRNKGGGRTDAVKFFFEEGGEWKSLIKLRGAEKVEPVFYKAGDWAGKVTRKGSISRDPS